MSAGRDERGSDYLDAAQSPPIRPGQFDQNAAFTWLAYNPFTYSHITAPVERVWFTGVWDKNIDQEMGVICLEPCRTTRGSRPPTRDCCYWAVLALELKGSCLRPSAELFKGPMRLSLVQWRSIPYKQSKGFASFFPTPEWLYFKVFQSSPIKSM